MSLCQQPKLNKLLGLAWLYRPRGTVAKAPLNPHELTTEPLGPNEIYIIYERVDLLYWIYKTRFTFPLNGIHTKDQLRVLYIISYSVVRILPKLIKSTQANCFLGRRQWF